MKKLIFSFVLLFAALCTSAQWTTQTSGTTNSLNSVYFTGIDTGYVIGGNGTILKTINGGTNWSALTSGSTINLSSVFFTDINTGYAVGNSGAILKTINGGTSWTSLTSGTTNLLCSVFFTNTNTGYVVGSNGTILKTINGGTSWVALASGITNVLRSVYFTDTLTGFVVGDNGRILKTIDAGTNWILQTSGTNYVLYNTFFHDASNGYAVGTNGTILKTINGGTSWTIQTSGTTNFLSSIHFTDVDTGCAIGANGTILKTIDGGINWTAITSGTTNNLWAVHFINSTIGYVFGSAGIILKTINGGWCTGLPGKPTGASNICNPSGSYQYNTTGSAYATSYAWSLNPSSAGIITGTGTTSSVTWSGTFYGSVSVVVQGIKTGCTGENSAITVLVGNSNPSSFSLSSPANGAYTSTTPLFQWGASTGALSYSLFIDGVLKKDNINTTSCQILSSEAISGGMHTWYVLASNGCTTQSNETWSILVDATSPAAFNLVSPANKSWTTNLQPTLTWSASGDANSGLSHYELWIDGSLNRDNISNSSTATTPSSNLTNGSHTWMIKAIDNVGNIRNSTQTWTIKTDNVPPGSIYSNCVYFDGTDDYAMSNQQINIGSIVTVEAWVYLSPFSGADYGIVSWSDGSLRVKQNGIIEIYIGNGVGNIRKYSNSSIQTSVWTHIAVVKNYGTGSLIIYINGSLDASYTGVFGNAPGQSNINFGRAYNNNSWGYLKGYIDEIRIWNIELSSTQIQNTYNNVIEGTCNNNLVINYKLNDNIGNTTLTDASNNNYSAALFNHAYLTKCTKTSQILGNGLCNLKYPSCSQYIQTTTPTFNWGCALDTAIGFQKFQLYIDGALNKDNLSDSSWTVTTPLAYGQHTWFVKGFDSLGNNQSSYSRIFYIDNAKPNTFNLTSPTNNQIVALPTPNLSWQATTDSIGGSGLRKYQLWINGVKNRDSIPTTQTTVAPSSALAQGVYTWYIKAYDNVGNIRQSSQTWTFYVDWEPPTDFTLISPTDNETVAISRPTFVWHPSSDIGSGLNKYELNISGYSAIVLPPTDTTYSISFDIPNGSYSWYVKAYDLGGATTSSNTNALNVNVPLPLKPSTPAGIIDLCYNPSNSAYTIPKATYATSYIWSITPSGAGTITGTDTIATVDWNNTYSGSANITVKGHNTQGDGPSSDPLTITINPLPDNAVVPTGTTTLCQNSVNTDYTTTIINNATSYIWSIAPSGAGTITGIGATGTVDWDNSFSGAAYISVKGHNNCGDGLISSTLSVTVNPYPLKAATPIGSTSLCQNPANTIYSTTGATNGLTYSWSIIPDSAAVVTLDVTQKNATLNWSNTYTGSIKIAVQGHNSCGDGIVSDTITVTINPLSAAPTATSPVTYCQNTSATPLAATGSNLLWYTISTGGIGSSTSPTPSTTGAGTTTYYVSQTSNGCESPRASINVIVNPLPISAGTITGIATVCQGQNSVTYTVPTITNATSYVWTLPIGATGTSTTNSITINYGTSAVSGNITVKGNNSCGNGTASTLAVTVNPLPASAGTISGSTTVCQGQNSVTYTVPTITNATSYIWTLLTGATGTSTTNSITVNYGTAAVSGNITVKGNNSCADGASSTLAITVNPFPAVAGTISGTTTVCQSQNSVTYTVPAIANATSYVWTIPTGATGTSTTNSITVNYGTSAISGNISVKGNNTCGDGATSSLAITVNLLPVSAGTISGTTAVCQGQSSITYTVPLIANATSYIWTIPTGATGTSTTNGITVNYGTSAISGNITVKGNNTCGDGATSTLAVTVTSLPESAGTITGTSTVCQNQDNLTYTVPVINNATSYIWTLPNGFTGASTTNSITIAAGATAASGNITVAGSNSCSNGTSSSYSITVVSAPSVFAGNDTTICTGTSITLTASGGNSYTWNNSVSQGVPFTPASTATYTVTVSNGLCTATDNVIVSVATPTTPAIYQVGNDLHSTISTGNSWYYNNVIINGVTSQIYTPTATGNYYSIVTDVNGCISDTSNVIYVVITGLSSLVSSDGDIKIFPNPAYNNITIENTTNYNDIQVSIFDISGQLLLQQSLQLAKTEIDISSFAKGVYVLKVENEKGIIMEKLIKE
jgi:photosystem II stability/assembly factor-like uncharacterized protein